MMGSATQLMACAGLFNLGVAMMLRQPASYAIAVVLTGIIVGIWAVSWSVLAGAVSGVIDTMPTHTPFVIFGNVLLGSMSGLIALIAARLLRFLASVPKSFLFLATSTWLMGTLLFQVLDSPLQVLEKTIITLLIIAIGGLIIRVILSSSSKAS
jgi:hypothetical protein